MNYIGENAFKEINENPIIIDFSECTTPWGLHEILKQKFGLPEYYGRNWDALWDCLDGLFYKQGEYEVHLSGIEKLKKRLDSSVDDMLDIFNEVHKKTPNVVFIILS